MATSNKEKKTTKIEEEDFGKFLDEEEINAALKRIEETRDAAKGKVEIINYKDVRAKLLDKLNKSKVKKYEVSLKKLKEWKHADKKQLKTLSEIEKELENFDDKNSIDKKELSNKFKKIIKTLEYVNMKSKRVSNDCTERDMNYYDIDPWAIYRTSKAMRSVIGSDRIKKALADILSIPIINHTKVSGVLYDENFPNYTPRKLMDAILYACHQNSENLTFGKFIEKYGVETIRCKAGVKGEHKGTRETYITTLTNVIHIKLIGAIFKFINKNLNCEDISNKGDKKFFDFQSMNSNFDNKSQFKKFSQKKGNDGKKWSTGDRVISLYSTLVGFLGYNFNSNSDLVNSYFAYRDLGSTSMLSKPEEKMACYVAKISGRTLEAASETIRNFIDIFQAPKVQLDNGWPEGFFNELSSTKHCGSYAYSIYLFNKYKENKSFRDKVDTILKEKLSKFDRSKSLADIKMLFYFRAHSDDSVDLTSSDSWENIVVLTYLTYSAKLNFGIRPNRTKDEMGDFIDYLSNYIVGKSVVKAGIKFAFSTIKDMFPVSRSDDLGNFSARLIESLGAGLGVIFYEHCIRFINFFVNKCYSTLKGMKEYNAAVNNYITLPNVGGNYYASSTLTYIFGSDANTIRLICLNEDSDNMKKLYALMLENNMSSLPSIKSHCGVKNVTVGLLDKCIPNNITILPKTETNEDDFFTSCAPTPS